MTEITQKEVQPVHLDIIYQDEYLVAINKPAGMLVHRSWLDKHETRFVMQTLRDQIGQHVYPVHRLDRPTSGVLLFALDSITARQLAEQFEEKKVEKQYIAIVRGYVEREERIDYPLKVKRDKIADKHAKKDKPPQESVTDYVVLQQLELPVAVGRYSTVRYTLLSLSPKTGRKHQLRRHMKHILHPIIGDSCYGDLVQNRGFARITGSRRLMLHAKTLKITHPKNNQLLIFVAELDETWSKVLNYYNWSKIR